VKERKGKQNREEGKKREENRKKKGEEAGIKTTQLKARKNIEVKASI
jgi:hypothetical protein